jgi:hypothetical protein
MASSQPASDGSCDITSRTLQRLITSAACRSGQRLIVLLIRFWSWSTECVQLARLTICCGHLAVILSQSAASQFMRCGAAAAPSHGDAPPLTTLSSTRLVDHAAAWLRGGRAPRLRQPTKSDGVGSASHTCRGDGVSQRRAHRGCSYWVFIRCGHCSERSPTPSECHVKR